MSSILVNTAVFHLKDDERKSALSMLLLLGLNQYSSKSKKQTVDMGTLQRLHGTCFFTQAYNWMFCLYGQAILELGNSPSHFNDRAKASSNTKKAQTTENKKGVESVKPPIPQRSVSAGEGRSPRSDSMQSFPFTDPSHSAGSLMNDQPDGPTFFLLGAPARKRVAAKAFADYSQGGAALPLANIPSALAMLGLAVSEESRAGWAEKAALAAKSPGVVKGTIRMEEWQVLVEKQVDIHKQIMTEEFNKNVAAISKRKMEMLHGAISESAIAADGSDDESRIGASLIGSSRSSGDELVKVLLASDAVQSLGLGGTDADVDPADIEANTAVQMALGKSLLEAHDRLRSMTPEQRKAALEAHNRGKSNVSAATRARWTKNITAAGGKRGAAAAVIGGRISQGAVLGYKDTYTSRIRKAQSKIAGQVQADKNRAKVATKAYKDSALKVIAKQKVDSSGMHYTAIEYPDRDRAHHQLNNYPLRAGPDGMDLDSGTASMHIAEAFLNGPIGQEMGMKQQLQDVQLDLKKHVENSGAGAGTSSAGGTAGSSSSRSSGIGRASNKGDSELDDGSKAESHFLLPAAELEMQVERMVQEKLDKIKAEKEKQREFVKPSADDLPKEWDSKNSGFVAEFGVKPNKNFER